MLRELKTFIAISQTGTFAAAGQQIGLTQSAVSAQMRILEAALGMKLFDRSGRAVALNANGNRVLPLAQEILDLFSRMAQPESLSEYRGAIKIGAIASVQTGILPAVLVRLRQQAPFLETRLVPGVSFSLLSEVDAGNVDVAIVIKPGFALPKDLYAETLLKEPFVLIAPPEVPGDDAITLIRDYPFIRYDRTSFGGRLVTQFLREQRLDPKLALEIDEIDAIARMVEMRLGVALVPLTGLWIDRPAAVRIVPLGGLTFYRELIVVMRHANRQATLHQFINRVLQQDVGGGKRG
ncbi:LysR family transcriptional regulator [Erwinia psidii]|uniref:LysR family transcriptional regulator n=1 Tax=Erwinia psidii TaxID=69224 RepID=A0A3N6UWA7_9GAMM|nr:LysR family transcriptional regulator [Erwinia psidii]MCX8956593.1 LysR family transcriptional regulator [Erwinia psidii]MCX8961497.1 LysR family transcriptional regulator [Erwinia psidii]MCX8965035.1 LysR family transcriptional regulator [Erwinia psidii]RQM40229.1 LysR family transcriptional regulator [Erwinia psidii]